jgi:hypothetical protein
MLDPLLHHTRMAMTITGETFRLRDVRRPE